MEIYMYYLGENEVKRMEREAVVNERKFLDSTHYTLAEPFPIWAMKDLFSYDFDKVRSSNGKSNGIPFVLSDNPDMKPAIRLFQEYLLNKIEEKEKQVTQLNEELSQLLAKSGSLCDQIESVQKEQEKQAEDLSNRLAWIDNLHFSDVWDKGEGTRAVYFDGPKELLEKFLGKTFPEASESDICLEYYAEDPTKTCNATISPVRFTEDGSKESYDSDYIDLSLEEIDALINLADEAIELLEVHGDPNKDPDEDAPLDRDAADNQMLPGNDEEP